MAPPKLSLEKMNEIRELAAAWGKIVARRVSEGAPAAETWDLAAMEHVAVEAAAALTQGTIASLLEQRAQALPAEHPCPACGHLCPLTSQQRALMVQGGTLDLHEPMAHCPDCRRDFFPPAAPPAPGQSRLQSDPARQDR